MIKIDTISCVKPRNTKKIKLDKINCHALTGEVSIDSDSIFFLKITEEYQKVKNRVDTIHTPLADRFI